MNVKIVRPRMELYPGEGTTKFRSVIFVVVDGRRRRRRNGSIEACVKEGDGVGRGVGGGRRIVG